MSLTPIYIAGYSEDSGYETDKKPFMLPDQAFPVLENAYVWRNRVKKREGNEKLGRLRRVFLAQSVGNSGASPWTFNVLSAVGVKGNITNITNAANGAVTTANPHNLATGTEIIITDVSGMTEVNGVTFTITSTGATTFNLNVNTLAFGVYTPNSGIWSLANQPNAELECGSVVIVIGGAITFTDQGDGTLTSPTPGNSGVINYVTGSVTLTHTAGAGVATVVDFNYFPSLPAMGIWTRDLTTVNDEQTVFFDTVYAYINTGAGFQEWIPGTVWNGSDSDFFLATNYRGIEPADRLFFVTNFVNTAANPMRYSDGSTWTDFVPLIGGTEVQESLGTVVTPWSAFAGNLTQLPIIKGTVVITVGDITFTDDQEDGTLTGLPPTNSGTINYNTGAITLTFSPVLEEDTPVAATYNFGNFFLFQAKILIPYYGRLLALNTWEGETIGTSTNIYNRCRFSQIGSPVQNDAWRSDIFGKGGFIDAPVAEDIVSATFFKNTLIVFFERSTWQLRYVGEYGLPFLWERISSDFGSESTFSTILFDEGVLTVGDKAIVSSSGTNVARIDEKIPDLVFTFRNANDGIARVHGARNFQKELAFWCYSDANDQEVDQYFPNKVLLANYRNKTFAILRDNITCFGTYQPPDGVTWDDLTAMWDDFNIFWDDADSQSEFPWVVIGNAQGYISYYLKSNVATEGQSLSITAIDLSVTPITLTIINHNLLTGELIYLTDLTFLDALNVPVDTDLNERIFRVTVIDTDTVSLSEWDGEAYAIDFTFTPDATATYVGCGEVTLLPKMTIQTKDFNPFQQQGANLKISYVDLLTDATPDSSVSVNLYINSAINQSANVIVGNRNVETSLTSPYYPAGMLSDYAWHRFFATSAGQYMRVEITYGDDLMNDIDIHNSTFVMNAMQLWMRPGSKNSLG